jgi:hypothetical protein
VTICDIGKLETRLLVEDTKVLNTAKMTASQEGGFEFIMQEPNESFSKETQTKIRRQAMRSVGAARSKTCMIPNPESLSRYPNWHLVSPMPLSGLELLVKDRGLDPMDLSALTSIHVGST